MISVDRKPAAQPLYCCGSDYLAQNPIIKPRVKPKARKHPKGQQKSFLLAEDETQVYTSLTESTLVKHDICTKRTYLSIDFANDSDSADDEEVIIEHPNKAIAARP